MLAADAAVKGSRGFFSQPSRRFGYLSTCASLLLLDPLPATPDGAPSLPARQPVPDPSCGASRGCRGICLRGDDCQGAGSRALILQRELAACGAATAGLLQR